MLLAVADQDAMQRVERQAEPVLTQKLAAQLLDAEVARAPEIENKRLLVGEHLLLRQVARTAALVLQSSDAIRLISAPPLPQRRPRNAAASADPSGIAKLLVKPDPAETSSCIHERRHAPGRLAVDLMDGACRPQLHSHNNIINLKAMESPKATYDRSRKSERMSPNPTLQPSPS